MAKYIIFEESVPAYNRPTYQILNKRSGDPLGNIFWYPPWRSYTASFFSSSVWSQDCLQDVAAFIRSLPSGRRQVKPADPTLFDDVQHAGGK